MEKLTEQLTVKVSEDTANLLHRLACADGISGADLLRSLIEAHIQKKRDEHILLCKAFGVHVNAENRGNPGGSKCE